MACTLQCSNIHLQRTKVVTFGETLLFITHCKTGVQKHVHLFTPRQTDIVQSLEQTQYLTYQCEIILKKSPQPKQMQNTRICIYTHSVSQKEDTTLCVCLTPPYEKYNMQQYIINTLIYIRIFHRGKIHNSVSLTTNGLKAVIKYENKLKRCLYVYISLPLCNIYSQRYKSCR